MASIPKYTGDSIRTLTTLEDFRMNSSQYVGSGGIDTDCQLLKEIIQNSQDESIDPNKIYTIKLIYFANGPRYQVAVIDYGRGIPCEKLKSVFTDRATSGKYSADAYAGFSVGAWGVGSKLTASLSKRFTAISKRMDGFAGIMIEKGVVKDYQILKPIDKDASTVGTVVLYETDHTILHESDKYMTDPRGYQETIKLLEYIKAFKANTRFEVYMNKKLLPEAWFKQPYDEQWRFLQSSPGELVYSSPDHITPFEYARAEYNITAPTVWKLSGKKTVDLTNPIDTMGYEFEIGVVKDCEHQKGMFGIVNGNTINSPKSSHLAVLQQRLKHQIRQYLDEDDTELKTFFDNQYELPIHGYTSVLYKCAKFIGQTKDAFIVADFARVYGQALDRQFNKEPDTCWEQLYDLIQEDLEHKFLAVNNKALQVGKSLKNAAFKISRIGSYISCAVNNPEVTELLITEGNSAGDFAKQQRDENFQAILKLRGKPINAIIASSDDLRSNAVYQDMIRLFGVGPRDTDLRNFNYKSVGLLADADPDGYHILTLLIGCIYKINPLILESGKVWIANPPLYVHETKDKVLYLRDQKALDDARVRLYDNFFDFHLHNSLNGNTALLTDSSYRDFIYLVKRIGNVINNIARKLVIDPFILEQLAYVVDYLTPSPKNCNKIKEILHLESCSYHPIANSLLLVDDGAEISIPLGKLEQEIRAYILPELQPIHWQYVYPLVTTKKTECYNKTPLTYMQINKIFEKVDEAYPVRRIKGLGECEPEQLKYSCLDPATRTYTTITSVGDVDRVYQMLGVDTSYRKELSKTSDDRWIGDML